ncbi:MAG: DUF2189 domain-containing protein [Maricaulaceae bacterium]|jgi:uncharacterized membrane protein
MAATHAAPHALALKRVSMDRPWSWLAAGWRDLWRAPALSLGYGAAFVLIGLATTLGLWRLGLGAWVPIAVGAFAFVGPIFAVGLYEISRVLNEGGDLSIRAVIHPKADPGQLAMLGFALALIYMVWVRAAQVIVAFFIQGDYVPMAEVLPFLLTTPDGLALLAVGSVVGFVLALAAFAISAVSAPILMRREVDVATAVLASLRAVREQPGVMLLWAWIVAVVFLAGAAAGLVGLVVAFPLLGHATWHAYRDLVTPLER